MSKSSPSQWSVYLVRCRAGTLYTGIATDVSRRFSEHQGNASKCAKYLRGRGPLELVLQQAVGTHRTVALRVERQIKRLRRSQKEALLMKADALGNMIVQATRRATEAKELDLS